MRELNIEEIYDVGGGYWPALMMAGAIFAFGYGVGKDMALSDKGCDQ